MAGKRGIRRHPWLILAVGLCVLILLLLAVTWAFRLSLAGWAGARWCASRDFECRLDVTALGLTGLTAENLRMRARDGDVPFEAARAEVDWTWPSLLRPEITSVTVARPTVRGVFSPGEDQPMRFGGLESLASGGGGGQPVPELAVSNAKIELKTPAGLLVTHGSFTGQLPYQGHLDAQIDPVELNTDGSRLVLRQGQVDVRFNGLQIDGTVQLDLAEANLDALGARDVSLSAEMSGTVFSQVEWQAKLGEFSYGDTIRLSEADLSGTLKPKSGADDRPEGVLARLGQAAMSGTLARLETRTIEAGPADISLDLERSGPDELDAEFAVRAEEIAHTSLQVGRASLSGTASMDNSLSRLTATGDLAAERASVASSLRREIVSKASLGQPLDAHSNALKAWLDNSLSAFDLGTGFDARLQPRRGDWSVVSSRALTLQAANGTQLRLDPRDTVPALNIAPGMLTMSGLLDISGGGGPDLAALIRSVQLASDAPMQLEAGGVSLQPWTAGGLTLSADLDEVTLSGDGPARLKTVGELRVDGPLYGMGFDETRIFGGIEAVFDTGGLRVQTYQTRCLGLGLNGLEISSGVGIGQTSLEVCPVDGRVVRQSGGVASGRMSLGDVSLPFTTQGTSGTLSLEGARLDWQAGQKTRMTIDAEMVRLPLQVGGDELVMAARTPAATLTSGRPARLSASVQATEFSGSILPVQLSLAGADFEANLAEGGLDGQASARRVEVRDPGEDPLYEPLTGDLTANFANGAMTVSGPITTPRAPGPVARAEMTLGLSSLDGHARIVTERLEFEPGGLQPTALSDRVRGFLSNARGTLEGEATFEIDGGMPSGTGRIGVSDFGFDTLRVGAVSGVNGQLEFSNILSLTTPPGQEVRVGQINPGIPLENGRISFQLVDGRKAIIEEARWPFAGGELIVGETGWTVAGTSDTIRIRANRLELSEIISTFSLPDIQASGTVSGEFPVEIDGPNAYVRDATLKADETGGKVAYTGDIADAASQADERVRMAFNALRDFRFSVLELGANGNLSGDMMVTMKLIGRSPEVLDGAPFAFNIGVDSKLMQLIQTGRSVTTSDWLVDAVSDAASGGSETETTNPETQSE